MQDPQYPQISPEPDESFHGACAVAEIHGWHMKIHACRHNGKLFWRIESDGLVELYAPEVKVECTGHVQVNAKSLTCQVDTATVQATGHVQLSAKSVTCEAEAVQVDATTVKINADVDINGTLRVRDDVIHDGVSIGRLHGHGYEMGEPHTGAVKGGA